MDPRVNLRQTDVEIAATCIRYLNLSCFDRLLTDEVMSTYTYEGYYAFQEYAVGFWLDHLQSCLNAKPCHSSPDLDQLSIALDKFIGKYLDIPASLIPIRDATSRSHRVFGQLHFVQSSLKKQTLPRDISPGSFVS